MGVIEDLLRLASQLCCPSPAQEKQEQEQHEIQEYGRPQAAAPAPAPIIQEQPKPHRPPHEQKPHHEQQQRPDRKHDASPRPHVNRNQENHNNSHYTSLRAQASEAGDTMAKLSRESQEAFHSGDGAKAKELSNESKRYRGEMERLNKEASDWIFRANNEGLPPGEVDLHGLFVKEAIEHTRAAIEEAKQRGETEVRLIVGKGLHSANHEAKLKPEIEKLMSEHNLLAELDPSNSGVLIVHLDGRSGTGETISPDEMLRRYREDKESCRVM